MKIVSTNEMRRQPKKLSNGELNILIVEKNDKNIRILRVDRRQLSIGQILGLRMAGFKVKRSSRESSLRVITW